jgi:hypothetical protein
VPELALELLGLSHVDDARLKLERKRARGLRFRIGQASSFSFSVWCEDEAFVILARGPWKFRAACAFETPALQCR